jgi:hypothetical protein
MPKRALAEKRPVLLASLVAAVAFYYLRVGPWPELYLVPLKGAAVALMGLYAYLRHPSGDARMLAVMLGIAAFGEMALEADWTAAVVLWFAHHVVALMFYLRHRRPALDRSQKWTTVALLIGTPVIAGMLPGVPRDEQVAGLYGLALGGMAAAAWASSFPRYRAGAGAAMIVAAHLLLVAELGALEGSIVPSILAWPLTYLGLLLIVTGVSLTLRKRDPLLKLVSSRRQP